MFGRKNIFFEKSHNSENENNGTKQTQQKNADTDAVGE
jgi:hypothetical protein